MQPPSFLSRRKVKKEPYMYIEVNMGAGRVGKIGVHEGDDPAQLAHNFCRVYGLSPSVQSDIEELLLEQIELE
jgi:hypothetical protein